MSDEPRSETDAPEAAEAEPETEVGTDVEEQRADGLLPKRQRAVVLRSLFLVFCALGMTSSILLTQVHHKTHTMPDERSWCSLSAKADCGTVAESPWAVFLWVPVSVWALLAYAVLMGFGLAFLIRFRLWRPLPGLAFLMALGAVGVTALMAWIAHFLIGSLCVLCAVLYLVNPVLLLLAWLLTRRFGGIVAAIRADLGLLRGRVKMTLAVVLPLLLLAGALMAWFPKYWHFNEPAGPGNLPHGETKAGLPWIGAREPRLIIHEFSDYQCPYCRRRNASLRKTLNLKEFTDSVRLVHYQYPLDHHCNASVTGKFHLRACELAKAAMCAGEQGKFWFMHDMLYSRQKRPGGPDVVGLAGKLKLDLRRFRACLGAARTTKKLKEEIALGDRMAKKVTRRGVPGTPFYLFERPGEALQRGSISPVWLRRMIRPLHVPKGPGALRHGKTPAGQHWVGGGETAAITLYELSDYECYYCKVSHAAIRQQLGKVASLGAAIRLVRIQYPLNRRCNFTMKRTVHRRACQLISAAYCAGLQGKFWLMNDLIYETMRRVGAPTPKALAARLKLDVTAFERCLVAPETRAALKAELTFGESLGKGDGKGVDGVPTYFYRLRDGKIVRSRPPRAKDLMGMLRQARGDAPKARPRPR